MKKIKHITDLENNGFSKIEKILSQADIEILRSRTTELLSNVKEINYDHQLVRPEILNPYVENYKNDIVVKNFFNQKVRNCLCVDKDIDLILDKFFSNTDINSILNYFFIKPKIHGCAIRMANQWSNWLGVHSDSDATLTMSIFLNDIDKNDSTTTFIKGSHLFKKPVENKIERLNPSLFSNLISYSVGMAGDVGIFFNRTAHGVVKQSKVNHGRENTVILIGFHCDKDLQHHNLLLPSATLYGKNIKLLSENFLKFFETNGEDREIRVKKSTSKSKINEICTYRKLLLNEKLTYIYLSFFAYFIFFIKFMKAKTNINR